MEKISLKKRSEQVKINLKKAGLTKDKVTLRVGAALDKSGSAEHLYKRGEFDSLMDRLLPVADNFDDNGEIDMWLFDNYSYEVEPATAKNYGGYIRDVIMKGKYANKWGGTSYSPVLQDIADFYFGDKKASAPQEKSSSFFGKLFSKKEESVQNPVVNSSEIPALVFFVTDGENNDKDQTQRLLESVKDKPIYWMMVGVGSPSSFRFIEKMADTYDNVGFLHFNNLDMTDDQLYDSILSGELTQWINKVGA